MEHNQRRGIVLMSIAMLVLATMDAISKHLAETFPVSQILAVRFWLFTVFAVMVLSRGRISAAIRTAHPWLQLARGLVITCEVAVFVLAFKYLSLAQAHAIAGVAPLLVTALAVVFLGERVSLRRWGAVAAGFVGLLVILRPGFTTLDPALLIPLGGAVLWAVYQVLVRRSSDDSAATQMFYMALVGAVVMSIIAPFYWVVPSWHGALMLLALGVVGSVGHWLIIRAIQSAPASTLQPFHYTVLIWATLLGFLIDGDLPDGWTFVGGLVIALSGIYAWYCERSETHAHK